MNEFYRAKFNELFMEFTRYLITHPDFGEDIGLLAFEPAAIAVSPTDS